MRDIRSTAHQVTHAIHKDPLGLTPPEGQCQLIGVERHRKSLPIARVAHRLEVHRQPLGITVLAPRTHLGAAGHGVPGGIRPFNR
jgi:hypothetical protein